MNTARSRRGLPGVLARRRPQISMVVAATLLVAASIAVVKPRDYRAATQLRITGAKSLQADQLAQRVDAIARELVAPGTLETVAQRLPGDRLDAASLQANTVVEAKPAGPGAWDVTIAHISPDPEVAARVVETLAADYQATAVQRPIELKEREIAGLETRAAAAEAERTKRQDDLDRYVNENQSYLEGPEQRLAAVREQLRDVERVEISSYEGEIERLTRLMSEEPEFIVEEKQVRDDDRVAALRKEIRDVEAELTVLQVEQNRTEAHPAVVAKRKILTDLQDELARVQRDVRTETVKTPNDMYASLAKAKVEAEGDLARARRKLSVLRTKEGELLEEVRRAPDLRGARDRLAAAVDGANTAAETANAALAKARSELDALRAERPLQFATVVPPETPRDPAGPGTLVIAGMGLLAGAFLGIGTACVADARDRSFRDPRKVSALLGLPTLGAIDTIRTPAEERALEAARKRRTNALVGTGLAVFGLFAFAWLGDATPLQDMVRSLLP